MAVPLATQVHGQESAPAASRDSVLREFGQALAAQQLQIEELRKDLRRRDDQMRKLEGLLQQMLGTVPAAVEPAHPAPAANTQRLEDLVRQQQAEMQALRAAVESQRDRIALVESQTPPPPLPAASAPSLASAGRLARLPSLPASSAASSVAAPANPQVIIPVGREPQETEPARWYEKINLRGYAQFRYNRLMETNPNLVCEQCDRSLGDNSGFFIRRARMIFFGDLHDRVSMYFQPDFASSAGSLHYGQLRDLYFDVNLDEKKEFRLRVGQSKVPYGFENLQSSQNRLALDRSDSVNSAVLNERDLGVFFMYAPSHIRERFRHLVASGLKGSGDYGVIATGLFNGQTANRPEANNGLHRVARISYPFQIGNQIIEPAIQGYTGEYTVGDRGASTLGHSSFADRRAAATLVLYPQPFGFQAEYNVGRGPAYNPLTHTIEESPLKGGYAQAMYRRKIGTQFLTAFVKSQYYDGGKKYEFDARRYLVRDQELGVEWQPNPAFELTAIYAHGDRTTRDSRDPLNRQKGNLLRLQMQFNY